MDHFDWQRAFETYNRIYQHPSDPVRDYHDISVAAVIEGLNAMETCTSPDGEPVSPQDYERVLKKTIFDEIERLLGEKSDLEISPDQRRDIFTYAAGQVKYVR